MMNLRYLSAALLAVSPLAFAAGSLSTEDVSGSPLTVTANVQTNCTNIEVADISFDVLQGEAGSGSSDIKVTCGMGTAYIIGVERGDNADSTATARKLASSPAGTDLNYKIVSGDCNSATEVGTTSSTLTYTATTLSYSASVLSGTGSGIEQTHQICAKVLGADTLAVPADTYDDFVTVKVVF